MHYIIKQLYRNLIWCLLLLVILSNCCRAQIGKSNIINASNYYDFYVPNEKTLVLSEGEIKIILAGELKNLGINISQHNFQLLNPKNNHSGKMIQWLDVSPYWHGIYLDLEQSFGSKDRIEFKVDTGIVRGNEWTDPIELPYFTLRQSCYWYQQIKNKKAGEFVSRSVIVNILREDIKKMTSTLQKK